MELFPLIRYTLEHMSISADFDSKTQEIKRVQICRTIYKTQANEQNLKKWIFTISINSTYLDNSMIPTQFIFIIIITQ